MSHGELEVSCANLVAIITEDCNWAIIVLNRGTIERIAKGNNALIEVLALQSTINR